LTGPNPVTKSAYLINMTAPVSALSPVACNGAAGAQSAGFFATADPVAAQGRHFGSNTTGTIWVNAAGAVAMVDPAVAPVAPSVPLQ
jgi:hypothetical protein